MNWFKKFIDWLNGEDVIEEYELEMEKISQQKQTSNPAPFVKNIVEKNNPISRDELNNRKFEARVKFQYPKTQFRFPVVPDSQIKRGNRVPKKETAQAPPVIHKVKREVPDARASTPKKEVHTKKIEPKSKQPFKPTPIPSPIYGFNNRPKKEKKDIAEFELKNDKFTRAFFEKVNEESVIMRKRESGVPAKTIGETDSKKAPRFEPLKGSRSISEHRRIQNEGNSSAAAHNRNEDKTFREAVNTTFKEEEGKKENLISSEKQEVNAAPVKIEMGSQEQSLVLGSTKAAEKVLIPAQNSQVLEAEMPSAEYEAAAEELSAVKEMDTAVIVEEPSAEYEAAAGELSAVKEVDTAVLVEEPAGEYFETTREAEIAASEEEPAAENLEAAEEESAAVMAELVFEENEPAKLEEELVIYEEPQADNTSHVEPPKFPLMDHETTAETYPNEGLGSSSEETDQLTQEEAPKRPRSHIPFNVVMLKQDKQKWTGSHPRQNVKENKIGRVEEANENNAVSNDSFFMEDSSEVESRAGRHSFPALDLLTPPVSRDLDEAWIQEQSEALNDTLVNFNVRAKVVNVSQGPSVTRFEVQPEPGVKVNKITNLSDDIKLSLAARDIRIEAPIPGKHTVGIEIPNPSSRPVFLSEIIKSRSFQESDSPLTAALGLDISGKPIVTDLRKMPHGLIAGATGSGKSVCINSILVSLLYKADPRDLKLLLIDPKMVELAPYNRIPHLVSPVITDVKAATAALKWTVDEMERRYELFAHAGVRDITRFNEMAERRRRFNEKLPYIVVVIDELADLMMMSPDDVETAICRIAQKARACGIHLIIATQRPSVDVITGLIKANIPTRAAFSVSSQIDSRTIIDMGGAEKLLGRGDMLFLENGASKPLRLQGTFVSDEEIDMVVEHAREQGEPNYLFEQEELLKKSQVMESEDELFFDACEFVIDQDGASASLLQRHFRIGYNRAARLIELMEAKGIISEPKGSKPRDILISMDDFVTIQDTTITGT